MQDQFRLLHSETACTMLLQVYTDTYSISVLVSAELPCEGRGFPQHWYLLQHFYLTTLWVSHNYVSSNGRIINEQETVFFWFSSINWQKPWKSQINLSAGRELNPRTVFGVVMPFTRWKLSFFKMELIASRYGLLLRIWWNVVQLKRCILMLGSRTRAVHYLIVEKKPVYYATQRYSNSQS
jgi:hypothetical protein